MSMVSTSESLCPKTRLAKLMLETLEHGFEIKGPRLVLALLVFTSRVHDRITTMSRFSTSLRRNYVNLRTSERPRPSTSGKIRSGAMHPKLSASIPSDHAPTHKVRTGQTARTETQKGSPPRSAPPGRRRVQ